MSTSDLENAKTGAKAVLELFNPEMQYVGLAVLQADDPDDSGSCISELSGEGGDWLVVPLSNDYQNEDGSLKESSELVSTINDLQRCDYRWIQTNLGSPLSDGEFGQPDALTELLGSGRDVKQGVIFMTDGQANQPVNYYWRYGELRAYKGKPCQYGYNMASLVKGNDIEIFTIGYGIENARCTWDYWRYSSYSDVRVTELLADMATDSLDEHGHCLDEAAVNAENADGDHFMCVPRGDDLKLVFRAAAAALSTDIKLIIYPEE